MKSNIPIWEYQARIGCQFGNEGIKAHLTLLCPIELDLLFCEVGHWRYSRCIVRHNIPVPTKVAIDLLNFLDRS